MKWFPLWFAGFVTSFAFLAFFSDHYDYRDFENWKNERHQKKVEAFYANVPFQWTYFAIDSDGMVICDVQEMVDDVVVRSDTNIGFRKSDNMPFELTDEEIQEIQNPTVEQVING